MTEHSDINPWAGIMGPCYTAGSLARTLGWTESEAEDGDAESCHHSRDGRTRRHRPRLADAHCRQVAARPNPGRKGATPEAIRDAWDYIDGRRTLDELIEDVRRRHTRRPGDES